MASTMYGTPMVSNVMPNPMGTPMMSTVMPNPTGGMIGASSTGVQGLPMSTALPIPVNENTPNLAEIQSFPVIIRGNGIHMHQDPVSGQRYRMNDEFHSRIPEILSSREMSRISQQEESNSVELYLKSLMTSESKPSNLVTNTMESFSASTINSQNIMDSSLGLVSILETANTPTVSTNRTVFISPNVNIPGAPTQLEKNKIQTRIQDSISSRPFTQTFNTQTQQFRIDGQSPIITNINTFSNISVMPQVNLSKITNTYPVNTFSTVTGNFGFTPTQQEISLVSNRFGTIGTPSSTPVTSNAYSMLPTNKFYNS